MKLHDPTVAGKGPRRAWGRRRTVAPLAAPLLLVGSLACSVRPTPRRFPSDAANGAAPAERFLSAFLSEHYEEALGIVDEALASSPGDGMLHSYRGAALASLGRHEEAVESFRRAECRSAGIASDRIALYLRAVSLYQARLYARARQSLDELARFFPHSLMAEWGQQLAIRIERGLRSGISGENLNWYLNKALGATASSRPALAIEYYEECLLLTDELDGSRNRHRHDMHLGLGASYLDLGAAERAADQLMLVPPSHQGFRAAMLHAMALRAAGRRDEAKSKLAIIVSRAEAGPMRRAAQEYLRTW